MDVFFYETFEEEAEALKRYLGDDLEAGFSVRTVQEDGASEPPAGLISIRTQSVIPSSWVPGLSGVLARSTGYDHLERFLLRSKSQVPCGYLPLYCSRAVAEQALLLWLALQRRLFHQTRNFSQFDRDGLTGYESYRKTLLVVGVGNIGYEVVKLGRGLGMHVLGVDLVEKHRDVEYVDIYEGLSHADVIVCAMNLTPENHPYFTYSLLKRSKPGAIFVNIARGELAPSIDLLRLLDEGKLGGIGLDVFNHEPEMAVALRTGKPSYDAEAKAVLELRNRPNVLVTPHNAFNTYEALDRKSEHTIQQVRHFLGQGEFLWSAPPETAPCYQKV